MMRNISVTVMLSLLICSSACQTTPGWGNPEENPYQTTFGGQSRIQFEDVTVTHLINVVRVDTKRVGDGLMRIILTLRNTTKDNLWAEIRTTFLDEEGHMLEQTNWEPIGLEKRSVTEYTCTSFSNKAADYQIIIHKAEKSALK
jgi:hypothetical protein